MGQAVQSHTEQLPEAIQADELRGKVKESSWYFCLLAALGVIGLFPLPNHEYRKLKPASST
jgi:hypothetical protein